MSNKDNLSDTPSSQEAPLGRLFRNAPGQVKRWGGQWKKCEKFITEEKTPLHVISFFGDSQVRRIREVWPAGIERSNCKFTILKGKSISQMVKTLHLHTNKNFLFKLANSMTSLVIYAGSVNCLQCDICKTIKNICEYIITLRMKMEHLTIYVCTVSILSDAKCRASSSFWHKW